MTGSVREISLQKANEICKSLVNYTTSFNIILQHQKFDDNIKRSN